MTELQVTLHATFNIFGFSLSKSIDEKKWTDSVASTITRSDFCRRFMQNHPKGRIYSENIEILNYNRTYFDLVGHLQKGFCKPSVLKYVLFFRCIYSQTWHHAHITGSYLYGLFRNTWFNRSHSTSSMTEAGSNTSKNHVPNTGEIVLHFGRWLDR
jgi:hypothetical protein